MQAMLRVGNRLLDGHGMADQGRLARTAALLRGTAWLVPRGIYRFSSFAEADSWMTETILRTRERLSPRTSSDSAAR
jgi:hypothetical protein